MRAYRIVFLLTLSGVILTTWAAPAHAHATIVGAGAGFPVNTDQNVTMEVPHERDDVTYNVEVVIGVPTGWKASGCQTKPTWTCTLGEQSGRQIVRWVKAAGAARAEDEKFVFSVRTAATPGQFAFPTVQTYNTGEAVSWIGEPTSASPAPRITTLGSGSPPASTAPTTPTTQPPRAAATTTPTTARRATGAPPVVPGATASTPPPAALPDGSTTPPTGIVVPSAQVSSTTSRPADLGSITIGEKKGGSESGSAASMATLGALALGAAACAVLFVMGRRKGSPAGEPLVALAAPLGAAPVPRAAIPAAAIPTMPPSVRDESIAPGAVAPTFGPPSQPGWLDHAFLAFLEARALAPITAGGAPEPASPPDGGKTRGLAPPVAMGAVGGMIVATAAWAALAHLRRRQSS